MINSAVIGKDPNGRIWFKSDHTLTDITDAKDFYVQQTGWWKKKWRLCAVFVKRASYYRDNENNRGYVPAITEEQELGIYDRPQAASLALECLMNLKQITEIDPITGR